MIARLALCHVALALGAALLSASVRTRSFRPSAGALDALIGLLLPVVGPATVLAGLVLELAEGFHRMHGQADPLHRVAGLTTEPGTLGGRHLADIAGALDQQHVGPSRFREGIGHAAPDGAAADDDELTIRKGAHAVRSLFRYHCTKLFTLYSLKVE